MSLLFRSQQLKLLVHSCRSLGASPRLLTYWNKDYKPGPYPKTKEERDAAAKKYNLLPEEYEPYPDDGMGYGDYPKLPDPELRDVFYPWTNPEYPLERNFGEPVHVLNNEPDIEPSHYSDARCISAFLGCMIGCFSLFHLLENCRQVKPRTAKQYPHSGEVHYTFEPNIEDSSGDGDSGGNVDSEKVC